MTDLLREQLQTSLGTAYTIERELGGGGMSRVFVAEETRFRRRVVVKVLPPGLAAGLSAERFEREIGLAARLQQANIVPVLAAGDVEGLPWYTMPYVEGESLRARLDHGPLPPAEAVSILRDVGRALGYAHGRGIVHRDIKPENVLLSSGAAVVTDFGIAKAVSASRTRAPGGTLTQVGTSLGTPAYMAPEQAAGDDVDHRADLYAWGVMAYELLAGKHPFANRTTAQQLIAAHIAEVPAPLATVTPTVPAPLAALVTQTLAKNPVERPASADELLRRLDDPDVATGGRAAARPHARRLALVGGAVAVAALLSVAAFAWRRGGETRASAAPATADLAPERVVVATFINRTGDASLEPLGAMAADWIARGLANTGLVDVAGTQSDLVARDAAGASAAAQSLAGLAAAAKARLVISGGYYKQGDSIAFVADFTNAAEAKRTQSVGPVAAPASHPLDAVERLRQRVTASLATMLDPKLGPLSAATTQPPSMEAYREFLAGEELFYKLNSIDAIPHYARAAALDSGYSIPLVRTMFVFSNLRRYREADSVGRLALRRADRLTPYERAYVEYGLAVARNDGAAAYEHARAIQRAAPKSAFAASQLAIAAQRVGRMREADSIYDSVDPQSGELRWRTTFCQNWVVAPHALGQFERMLAEGERYCPSAAGRSYRAFVRVQALAALGRERELQAAVDEMLTHPPDRLGGPGGLARLAVLDLRAHGHAGAADRLAARLVAWHDSASSSEAEHGPAARLGALFAARAWARVQQLADSMAAEQPDDLATLGMQGVAHAMRGDRAGAERIAARVARIAGPWQRASEFRVRGAIAAALGDRARAVELLRQASPPTGFTANQYHYQLPVVYETLAGYPPFEAMIRPTP